jgi:hypothetical protein
VGVRNLTTAVSEAGEMMRDSRAPPQIRGVTSERARPLMPVRVQTRWVAAVDVSLSLCWESRGGGDSV